MSIKPFLVTILTNFPLGKMQDKTTKRTTQKPNHQRKTKSRPRSRKVNFISSQCFLNSEVPPQKQNLFFLQPKSKAGWNVLSGSILTFSRSWLCSHVPEIGFIHDWKLSYSTEILVILEDEFLLCADLPTHPKSAQMTGSGLICFISNLHPERNPAVNNCFLKINWFFCTIACLTDPDKHSQTALNILYIHGRW